MLAATATEFTEFQPVGRGLLILGRYVVPALTCLTLKRNVVSRHKTLTFLNSVLCTLFFVL